MKYFSEFSINSTIYLRICLTWHVVALRITFLKVNIYCLPFLLPVYRLNTCIHEYSFEIFCNPSHGTCNNLTYFCYEIPISSWTVLNIKLWCTLLYIGCVRQIDGRIMGMISVIKTFLNGESVTDFYWMMC